MIEDYGASRFLADKALHLPVRDDGRGSYAVASGSEPGVVYRVTGDPDVDWRAWDCDCVAPGACSHMLAAAAYAATMSRRSDRRVAVKA